MLYLLHSTVPVGKGGRNGAQHYLGWCHETNLEERLRLHRTSKAHCALTRAFVRAGGKLLLAAILPGGTREDERKIKGQGHLPARCPICNPVRLVGWWGDNGVGLLHRRHRSDLPSERLGRASGGDWSAYNKTTLTSRAGVSPPAADPANSTPSGSPVLMPRIGGRVSAAISWPPHPDAISSVGTKPSSPTGTKRSAGAGAGS